MLHRALLLLLACAFTAPLHAEDWPQWLGERRDGTYTESGVAAEIPSGGLPIKWRKPAAYGYAGPSVADGKVYLFEYEVTKGEVANHPGRRDKLEGKERLRCLNAMTGREIWSKDYDCPYNVSYGGGPRCTPTVDGDMVYTVGSEGDLQCRKTSDGALVWKKSFKQDYGAKTPQWGHSAHPLVAGDYLYCVVGGKDALAVAFDKRTGEERWRSLDDKEPGYCPPVIIRHNGSPQLLIWSPTNLSALNPSTGKKIWSLPVPVDYGMSIMRPQIQGDRLYVSAIGGSSVLMKLKPDGSDVDVLWSSGPSDSMQAANVTPIFTAGAIYGCDCQSSDFVALSPEDGSRLWATKQPTIGDSRGRHGTAFPIRLGKSDNYYLFNELGDLITATLTPEGYKETGRMHVLEPTSSAFGRPVVWTCPALAGKCVFVRNDKEVVCIGIEK